LSEYNSPTRAPHNIRPLNATLPVSLSLRHRKPKRRYKRKKRPVTIRITPELFGRIMKVVDKNPGLTLSRFCEEALEKVVQKLEAESDRPTPLRNRFKAKRSSTPI
jgi:hypothetical protein